MPPVGFRKREHSPEPTPPSKRRAPTKPAPKKAKQTLFEAVDEPRKKGKAKSIEETKKVLDATFGGDDDEESLSDVNSDEFEDVPPSKRQKTVAGPKDDIDDDNDGDDDDDEEDAMDWEDAVDHAASTIAQPGPSTFQEDEIGDINISLNEDNVYIEPEISLATGKKGPTKRERLVRVLTHCLHVQSLMWHNTVRNSWLNDEKVQKSLVDGLTEGVKREVTRWKEAMGTLSKEELQAKKQEIARAKGRRGGKGKGKSSGRDWSYDAQHLEQGVPNLSQGDPMLRLLKVLTAYWRKRFMVTAPAIRKMGFMPLRRMRDEIKHWTNNQNDFEEHGERIENVEAFRELARKCEGSRDVGGQLFVALLRALGLETRMVTNLQPAGIGWSKGEDANEKRAKKDAAKTKMENSESDEDVAASTSKTSTNSKGTVKNGQSKATPSSKRKRRSLSAEKPTRKSSRGNKGDPININDSDSSLSEAPSDDENHDPSVTVGSDDDMSVVDITPVNPRTTQSKKYDRDLAFPTYWTEVCSPVSHKWIPVDPIVLSTIASNDELLQSFEPRGRKAENAKQVICYVLGFAADGSAKDVTIRYLKKHQLPGKTKGMRMPAEKVPIYNKRGKVKRYEDYDWFRTVMSLYDRPQAKRTTADDLEDQTDLKPFKPAKEEKEIEKESLQWYKQSADYVLEQHLRREEALLPHAKAVKTFTAGKGEKAKEHPVFLRSDVVTCKTVESWHKEGRAVKTGAQPMKHVPVRAVTLIRKREMEEHFKENGEKLQQGLYSWDQTDWIIPPPIENGVIPKNVFGNMDVYVETMVPAGAVHLPLKGSAKICRKLEIDYAEACTGFEFGKQRAVPILTGVVVAEEHEILVRDAWREAQAEIKRKEDTKRTAAALHWWRKMVMGMRIIERMRAEYDQADDGSGEINPFVSKARRDGKHVDITDMDEDAGAGGFFQPGHEEEEVPQHMSKPADGAMDMGGGFFVDSDDDPRADEAPDGGFLVEEGEPETGAAAASYHAPVTPVSLQSVTNNARKEAEEKNDAASDEESEEDDGVSSKRRVFMRPSRKQQQSVTGKVAAQMPTSDRDEENDASNNDGEDEADANLPAKRKAVKKANLKHKKAVTNVSSQSRSQRKVAAQTPSSDQDGENDASNEDGAEVDEDLPVKRKAVKEPAPKHMKLVAKCTARAGPLGKAAGPTPSDQESPLSEPSEDASAARKTFDKDDAAENEITAQVRIRPTAAARRRSSPNNNDKAIVAPPKRKGPTRRTTGRTYGKATPAKSQYFRTKRDEDEDEDFTEEEIVNPSRTTARTRSKR